MIAIQHLQRHEGDIFEAMAQSHATHHLKRQTEIAEALSERVLAPVGCMRRNDEILAFGDENSENLQERGHRVFRTTMMHSKNRAAQQTG